jgi:Transglutaminase-like superfamily
VSSRWADLPLAIRMLGWRLAIRPLKTVVALPRLVRVVHRPPREKRRRPEREARIISLSDRLCRGRLRQGTCLERSLLAYRFLSEAGAEPTLVVAVRREGDSFEWHAWATRNGRPVHETEGSLRSYLPVVIFDARGALEWSRPTPSFLDVKL